MKCATIFCLALSCCVPPALAQQPSTVTPPAISAGVPALVNFSGTLADSNGKPLTGVAGLTFLLYKGAQGGAPLWMETQNVHPDKTGHYSVVLGSTTSQGLPPDIFASGEARWLAVQVVGQEEQPRVLLVAVPYALEAGDAATIGGLPPSAFVLAAPPSTTGAAEASNGSLITPSPAVSGSGTTDFIPLWTNSTGSLGNSVMFQSGTGSTAKIGINTTAPASTLDVSGSGTFRGLLNLPATGAATATAGKNSQAQAFVASSFNSSTNAAVNQTFQWRAEPAGNNSASPSGTLNLLFGSGTTAPGETGLKLSSKGVFTFATGQTFPGTGTISGVTTASGTGLQGGGTTGTLALSLLKTCTSGQTLAWNGTAWACKTINGGGGGTVTSVGLVAPGSDFTVTGSPVTSSGNLVLSWSGSAPTAGNIPNAIVKRDSTGTFNINNINSTGAITSGSLGVTGNATFGNVNTQGTTITGILGVNGNAAVGGIMGIGTNFPQAELNLNAGGNANADTLLIGNNTSKGLQMRDNGSGVDMESIGVPLYVNYVTQQPEYLNTNGGPVYIGNYFPPYPAALNVGAIAYNGQYYDSAFFSNDVDVGGNFFVAGTKNFRIDHPLDPTNKYLNHSVIESSEVLNQYSGNVVLDAHGEARVEFPAWFGAINVDFRYQLTAIGAPGPNLYIAEEVNNNAFKIAGGMPGTKVSWQVTARRNDPYMRAHPYVVEQDKPEKERGYYTDPSLYGAPKEQGIFAAHQPTPKRP